MTIESMGDGRLRVWLDDREAQGLLLHTEAPNGRRLRRRVRQILTSAGQGDIGPVSAELIPVAEGWLLLICPLEDSGLPPVYALAGVDPLLELMERWPHKGSQPVCSLYEMGEEYRLTVYPTEPLTPLQKRLLGEYGRLVGVGEGVVAHTAEYGRLIATGGWITERVRPLPAHGGSGR